MKNLAICFALAALAFGCKTSQDSASVIDAEGANLPAAECCAETAEKSECSSEAKASCSAAEKASCSASESTCSGTADVN